MMPARILGSAYAVLALAALARAQGLPAGHWEGAFPLDKREVSVSPDLARSQKPEWIASMGIPSEKMTGLVVMDVMVNESSVSKVDLTFSPDGKMKGTISFPQGPRGPLPIEFKRTGEASVELIPASPAVSKDLEGDWEGLLETPHRAFRVLFHFKNQRDKTVAATIDTPETNAIGLPLNEVKQSGQKVEVAIKVANSSFHGTLNKESTELTGEWVAEGNRMLLTLRKK